MKHISLTNSNELVLVDDFHYERIMNLPTKWRLLVTDTSRKIVSTRPFIKGINTKSQITLSRFILKIENTSYPWVDHKDRNIFNNQESNLRKASCSDNNVNRLKHKNNTSGYKGVFWRKRDNKYISKIIKQHKIYYLGCFEDKVLAAIAYDDKAIELYGEFAVTNFPLYGA